MELRKANTAAAATSLNLLAGALGIALNSGIVGASGDDHVGRISPVATATSGAPLSSDGHATPGSVTASAVADPAGPPPVTSTLRDGRDERDGGDDGEHLGDDRAGHEGADDDD
jgi:hypothetical protein